MPFSRIQFLASLTTLAMASTSVMAEDPPITIDGGFFDWLSRPIAWSDPSGDGGSGVDLLQLRISDEPNWLQIYFVALSEYDLTENNGLSILLDTDSDPSTGLQAEGIGAELRFEFGEREGRFYPTVTSNPNSGIQMWHGDISLQGAPTVTSNRFEISMSRNATIDGKPVFPGKTISMVLVDSAGERMPDTGAIQHVFDLVDPPEAHDVVFDREEPDDIRLLSWNVLNDSPWSSQQSPRFERIIRAISPDVLNLQEIYNHSANQVRNLVTGWLGNNPGGWNIAGNNDCWTVSRYPILHSEGLSGNLAALLDTTDQLGRTLLVLNAHTPCCSNDEGRQWEIDEMMSFLGQVRAGKHSAIPADTAVEITGDLNLVGFRQQLISLIEGDIVNESEFGPDIAPDVDGSALLDTVPLHTQERLAYTWRNDNSGFWPGRLDVTIISDSVMELGNHYVVETRYMSEESLDLYGLNSNDSSCSDHLALVTDVRCPEPAGITGDLNGDGRVDGADMGLLLLSWNTSDPVADLNGSGTVGGDDLGILLLEWTG